MEIEVKEDSTLGRQIFIRIDAEKVQQEREKIVEEFRRQVQIEGFRKGKAPSALVSLRYNQAIQEQLLKNLIPKAYLKAIQKYQLSVVVDPEFSEVKLDNEGLRFQVYVEVKPQITLSRYQGLTLKKVEPEQITEEMVESVLKEWESKPELAVSIIDLEKRKAWKQRVREQLETVARYRARQAEERQIWEQLFAQVKGPVPEKLVQERAREYTEEELKRQNLQGKTQAEINKLAEEIFQKVRSRGEEDVRKYFILEKVVELEGITCTQEDLDNRVRHIARVVGETEGQVREKMRKAGRLEELRKEICLDKAFAFILEKAQVISRVILPGDKQGNIVRT